MIIRLDGTVQMAQDTDGTLYWELAAVMNSDGTINMNATQTKLDELKVEIDAREVRDRGGSGE